MIKKIAKIVDTSLGFEDHGIFTWALHLDYGGSRQSAGTFMLSHRPSGSTSHACGVDSWEKLKGRTVYALFDENKSFGLVIGLAPLPTEQGKEFIFQEVMLWPDINK